MQISFNLIKRAWVHIFIFAISVSISNAQVYYPYVLGYTAGQSVSATDFKVSYSGGLPVATTFKTALDGKAMAGMRYDLVLASNAFDKDLFVSKGYFPEYIQLRWELKKYQASVTSYRVFRKKSGTVEAFVQVAYLSKDASDWKDEFAEAGVLYEYKLLAEGIFPKEQKFLNFLTGTGFRLPSGSVSGRVTYKGGAAVQGVSLIAETEDKFGGTSLLMNGTTSYLAVSPRTDDANFKFDTAFTFQAWLKPTANVTSVIFQKGNQYKLTHSNGQLNFYAGAQAPLTLNFTQKVDTFFHVSAVREKDSLKIYVVYEEGKSFVASVKCTGITTAITDDLYMGRANTETSYFTGFMDEVRLWNRGLLKDEILTKSLMYISGTETGLAGYYRFNEGVGENFYDLSRKGFTFNEEHGFISNATWSTVIPLSKQLAVKGLTDKNGNYIISGIPYSSDGSTYRIIPVYQVHSFDPTEKLLFVGPGSSTFSDINFIDVSSFPVQGYVYYKNTKFPVEGVQIKIDGRPSVTSEGNVITTNSLGFFLVDVPIGKHNLQMAKSGHVFRNDGRFPSAEGSTFDFQSAYTVQTDFIDSTLIKVIGKVVGGPREAAKVNGYGRAINNVGNATIIMSTQKGFKLTDNSAGVTGSWTNDYKEGSLTKIKGTTEYTIRNTDPNLIELNPSSVTGEYFAYLLPEKYKITSVVAGDYPDEDGFHTTLDLENATFLYNRTDTILVDSVILANGTIKYNNRIDSVKYNSEKDFVFRVRPDISVLNGSGEKAFWDITAATPTGTKISIIDPTTKDPLTDYPVFSQRGKYNLKVSVFEKYTNKESSAVDNVPVKGGIVEVQNELAVDNTKQTIEINDFGIASYEFVGGLPNITGDYLKSMSIIALTGKNNSVSTSWQYKGDNFKAYLLGGLPTGSNFVTTGPNEVDMILRDPYGSNSYAYLEKGATISTSKSTGFSTTSNVEISNKVDLGAKVITFAGVGAGIITETETLANVTIGLNTESAYTSNNTQTKTSTTTKRWQTSEDAGFVGAAGDVFIGNSTNIVYGKSVSIKFLPATSCPTCVDKNVAGYQIAQDVGLRVNPEFNTAFMYSQSHIETALIPNLIMLRDAFLKKAKTKNYTSVYPEGDANFASKNTSGRINTTGYVEGNSYNFTFPVGWPADKHYEDTVAFYNKQILNWTNLLAKNEKEKLGAKLLDNLSFDAGVNYESSTTYETEEVEESTFDFSITPTLATEIGFEALGLGMELSMNTAITSGNNSASSSTNTKSITFGYVLSDGDGGDYYSIDVKQPESQTGPVFAVRGGQSSCPYVDVEKTKYYQEGTIMSEATAKREVPQIGCSAPIVNQVPEDQKAIYTVQLMNATQTGDDMWFMLEVNATKNTDGARVQLDGADIGNGKLIKVPAGASINKTISIEKIKPDVFNYDDIEIILHSVCQPEEIADTVSLTARFQPVCTKVNLTQPIDKWLINTSKIVYDGTAIQTIPLNFNISSYNLAHVGFEKILVEYKPTSSSHWSIDMVYYVDSLPNQPNPKKYIKDMASLAYTLEMKSLQDRNYDVRVTSVCANGTTNSSTISTGIKDTKRPKLFGTPQPADGILSPGEDVSIQFDETIQASLLISKNFQVKGVLNGAEIRHNSVLFFDGVDDNATVVAGPDLKDKSFTIEFWTQRANNSAGVIYSQGGLEIGFNENDNIYVKLGNQTIISVATYSSTSDWMHFAISYSQTDRKLNVFMNDKTALENIAVTGVFEPIDRLYIGRNMSGSNSYNGYIHEFRIWDKSKGFGTVYANMLQTLSGSEVGLVGYWPMDDANGSIANDKARSHHAILNGPAWSVFPRGYAMNFDGTSNYFNFPTGSSVITNEMDMTLEFWFKGDTKPNQVLFSNGKGDKTDASPDYANIWVVGSDDQGKLYAMNNGTKLSIAKNVFDNEWHHFALVVNRIANTSVYIDGSVEAYNLSSNFGGLSGATMTVGAGMTTSVGVVSYNSYFTGKIDEVRLWKLARTKKLLEIDMNAKLKGDEKGLLVYYPFDKYDVNLVLQSDNTDNVKGSVLTATTNASSSQVDVPNLKDARPVQNVAYDWVVNGDKIIINIKEPANLVEKTVLEFTSEDVEDLNENLLSSPITWTAFVKKNTVIWNSTSANFTKKQYDKLSFNVEIANIGGTEQNYEISNLPSWLTVDFAKGTLAPDSKKTLVFTVNSSINLGNYEESIFLSSDFGFKEKFDLKLNVFATKPNWVLDESKYQFNMSIIGSITIDGKISTNADNMIAAFVNDTLRGVGHLEYVPSYDAYMVFLDVFSNKGDLENVDFKVWNAAKGLIHVNVDSSQAFVKDVVIGSPSNPYSFKVNNNISTPYYLEKGWNWISFNLETAALNKSKTLLNELNAKDGDLIKGLGKFDQFGTVTGWIGEISNKGGFNLKNGYKIKVSARDTFNLVGTAILIDTVAIPLSAGWNWIGYPLKSNMTINDALANVNFENGDFIKGQKSFATYDKNLGWIGSLKFLAPRQSYMLKSKLVHSLTYPNPDIIYNNTRKSELHNIDALTKVTSAPWSFNESDFANSMSITMTANICNEEIDVANDYIGAFVGNQCRGFIQPEYEPISGKYFFFLTVASNSSPENVVFKYFDGSDNKEYQITENTDFVNDQILGSTTTPYSVNLIGFTKCTSTGVASNDLDLKVEIYPNPFSKLINIKINTLDNSDSKLIISNSLGQEVTHLNLVDGQYSWDGKDTSGIELSSGIYILTVKRKDKVNSYKIIKH
jgi:hypothetical protein